MDEHIQEFITIFERMGITLQSKKELEKVFKKKKKQNDFELYEEDVLREILGGGKDLNIVDKTKFVGELKELDKEKANLFCLFGTGSISYFEFSDTILVGTGIMTNFHKKLKTEITKDPLIIKAIVPYKKVEEVRLKLLFGEEAPLKEVSLLLVDELYDMSRKINETQKIENLRDEMKQTIKKIFEEQTPLQNRMKNGTI